MSFSRLSPHRRPFDALMGLQRELDRAASNPLGVTFGVSGPGVFPPVNVFSNRDGLVLRAEVPGVSPEQVSVESHGRTLTISGKRELTSPDGGSFHRHERSAGDFARSFQLPEDLDASQASATCKHGLLTISVPKKAEAKPRQIAVQAQ